MDYDGKKYPNFGATGKPSKQIYEMTLDGIERCDPEDQAEYVVVLMRKDHVKALLNNPEVFEDTPPLVE